MFPGYRDGQDSNLFSNVGWVGSECKQRLLLYDERSMVLVIVLGVAGVVCCAVLCDAMSGCDGVHFVMIRQCFDDIYGQVWVIIYNVVSNVSVWRSSHTRSLRVLPVALVSTPVCI